MVVKILYYFVFAFLGIMVFLLMQNPYDIEVSNIKEKVPSIEVLGVKNFSITEEGISSIATAKRVLRYNTHDEFYDISIIRREKKLQDTLSANVGSLVKDDLKLSGNVRYKNSDGLKFNSNEAEYNLKSKIFKTEDKFVIKDDKTTTQGNSLVYQTKDGKIYAQNIRTITKVDKK